MIAGQMCSILLLENKGWEETKKNEKLSSAPQRRFAEESQYQEKGLGLMPFVSSEVSEVFYSENV